MAALATDIGLDDMINLGLEPDINPQLMESAGRLSRHCWQPGKLGHFVTREIRRVEGVL